MEGEGDTKNESCVSENEEQSKENITSEVEKIEEIQIKADKEKINEDDLTPMKGTIATDDTVLLNKVMSILKEKIESEKSKVYSADESFDFDLNEADRFIAFTDAAVAIAMTLLILPLMEATIDDYGSEFTIGEYFAEHRTKIGALALSYCFIALNWKSHNRVFRHVARFTNALSRLNFLWMFGVVIFPVSTALCFDVDASKGYALTLYFGNITYCHICTLLMHIVVMRDKRMWKTDVGPSRYRLYYRLMIVFIDLVILILCTVLPDGQKEWGMMGLILMPITGYLCRRKWGRI